MYQKIALVFKLLYSVLNTELVNNLNWPQFSRLQNILPPPHPPKRLIMLMEMWWLDDECVQK
jgi:hypothetical protein